MRYSPWYYWYPWTNIKFLQTNDSKKNQIIIQSPPQIPNGLAYDTLLSEERNQLLSARIKQETRLLWTNRATYLCKCNGVADLKEYQEANQSCPPCMYYRAEFGHYSLKCVGINTRELPKLGSAETPLTWDLRCGWPQDTLLPVSQWVYAWIERNPKNWGALGAHPLWEWHGWPSKNKPHPHMC